MSGEKRTRIEMVEDDLRETRRALYDIQAQREKLAEDLKKARRENLSQVNKLQQQIQERDKKQADAFNELKTDMRDTATKHQQQLIDQRDHAMQEMQDIELRADKKIDNVRNWAKERLNEQRSEYIRNSLQQQQTINDLKNSIEKINEREGKRGQYANDYITDLESLIKSTDENLPHTKYTPGRLQRIKLQLNAAKHQLEIDSPSSTISTAQFAHLDLMDMQEEIQRKETEFEMTYRTVADAIGGLFTSVRNNRKIKLEADAAEQEVDYWTNGRYMNLEGRVEELQDYIRKNKSELTTEILNGYLDDMEKLTQEKEALVGDAVERIISSQMRAEMADVVIEKLEQQGYRLKQDERGYTRGDQRDAYMLKLSNVAGTEIVTVISPEEQAYQNVLSINTYNDNISDEEGRRHRNADILQALREGGLQTGETKSLDKGVEQFYDVGNLVKQGAQKLPAQVLQNANQLGNKQADSTETSNN